MPLLPPSPQPATTPSLFRGAGARLASVIAVAATASVVLAMPVLGANDAEAAGRCRPQKAKKFLIRGSYIKPGSFDSKMHQKSITYRTLNYGWVEGFGSRDDNEHPPTFYAKDTTFFGLPIKLNRKVVPALKCVEEEIHRACKKTPYEPKGIGGYRDHNTYRGGEITNHLYGIALDIDVGRNPCCGCVEPWPDHPLCKNKSIWEKTSMPKCFIDSFEKYGWYWLGRDTLEDTMHFEFLGDPKPFNK